MNSSIWRIPSLLIITELVYAFLFVPHLTPEFSMRPKLCGCREKLRVPTMTQLPALTSPDISLTLEYFPVAGHKAECGSLNCPWAVEPSQLWSQLCYKPTKYGFHDRIVTMTVLYMYLSIWGVYKGCQSRHSGMGKVKSKRLFPENDSPIRFGILEMHHLMGVGLPLVADSNPGSSGSWGMRSWRTTSTYCMGTSYVLDPSLYRNRSGVTGPVKTVVFLLYGTAEESGGMNGEDRNMAQSVRTI